MSLSRQPARRFGTRRVPRYPIASASALLAVSACGGHGGGGYAPLAGEPPRPFVEDPANATTVTVPSAEPAPSTDPAGGQLLVPVASGNAEAQGLADAKRAPRFSEDQAPLEISEGSCRGDCMPPFQAAAYRKDESQVRARADWCVRAARSRGSVAPSNVTVRAVVGADGVPHQLRIEPAGPPPPPDVQTCLTELVSRARLTPPESGPERAVHVSLQLAQAAPK